MNYRSLRACLLIMGCAIASACTSTEPTADAGTDANMAPALASRSDTTPSDHREMIVYKSPTCGCCKEWVSYVEKAGFSVDTVDLDDVDTIKAELGLTDPSLKSCHTAVIDGYVIEGHVPVSDIERLLAERPAVVGLTAPGMPMMSPGMASETPEDYNVLAFDKSGRTRIYSAY